VEGSESFVIDSGRIAPPTEQSQQLLGGQRARSARCGRAGIYRPFDAEDRNGLTAKIFATQPGHAQTLGDARRCGVVGMDHGDEARGVEGCPCPVHGGARRFGGVPVTPGVPRECPTNLQAEPPFASASVACHSRKMSRSVSSRGTPFPSICRTLGRRLVS
jgi:hypothetical protein